MKRDPFSLVWSVALMVFGIYCTQTYDVLMGVGFMVYSLFFLRLAAEESK